MPVPQTSRPAPFGAITAFQLIDRLDHVLSALRAHVDARQMRRRLEELTDEQLDDIGICRHDIDRAVKRISRWA